MRFITADVEVHSEVSMNATVVQRGQEFYVLAGTRKVHILRNIEEEFGRFYHFIGKYVGNDAAAASEVAVIFDGVVGTNLNY